MSEGTKTNVDVTFKESAEKRINSYDKNIEKARKRMQAAKTAERISQYGSFVEIPEFKLERKFDPETKKASYEMVAGTKKVAAPKLKNTRKLMRKAYYEAKGYVNNKISEYEEDNAGLEAAHKTEQGAEWAAATLKNTLPSGRQLLRKAQNELRRQARKAEKEYNYSLFKKEVAESAKKKAGDTFVKETSKNTIRNIEVGKKATEKAAKEAGKEAEKRVKKKLFQKLLRKKAQRELQKEAAKKTAKIAAAKAAETTAVTTGTTAAVGGTAVNVAGLASGVEEYLLIAVAVIVLISLVIILIAIIIVCILAMNFYNSSVQGAMYQSNPMAIEQAELHMTYLEASLKAYMEDIENQNPGYDGYITEAGDSIGHNPYTLINYLSAKYGEFEYDDVEAEIDDLFNTSYTLVTWVEDIEVSPPEEEEDEDEDDDDEEPETITLHILHIKLTRTNLEGIVESRLNGEEREIYDLYGETHGGLQCISSLIGGNYYGNISSFYGYRYHPIHEEIRLHRGLDIALPEGTDLFAGVDGTISIGDDPGGYGNFVTITGNDGITVRYAHMSNISVSQGQTVHKGDVLGQSGNTGASTGPHVHVEVIIDGEYYNPLFYLDTE